MVLLYNTSGMDNTGTFYCTTCTHFVCTAAAITFFTFSVSSALTTYLSEGCGNASCVQSLLNGVFKALWERSVHCPQRHAVFARASVLPTEQSSLRVHICDAGSFEVGSFHICSIVVILRHVAAHQVLYRAGELYTKTTCPLSSLSTCLGGHDLSFCVHRAHTALT